ncbi:MAG: TonB-dependent receptor [Pseudomonadales bacterium]
MTVIVLPATVSAQALEEIIVTAQKREQNLQDIPLSVAVTSGDVIEDMNMNDLRDLADYTPGMYFGGTYSAKPTIYLRGVGTDDFYQGSSSPVAVYHNGVYQGGGITHLATLLDPERVEILKGPQGTLWGRNTTGGLVNYVTRKHQPGDETNGYLDVSVAEYGDFEVNAALGADLSDTVGLRLAAKYHEGDGYFEALSGPAQGDDLTGTDEFAVRATFVIEASDKLTLEPSISYNKSERPTAIAIYHGSDTNLGPCENPGQIGSTCPGGFPFSGIIDPVPSDVFQILDSTIDPYEDITGVAVTLTADYDMDDLTFTSITAFQDGDNESHEDTGNANSFGVGFPLFVSSFASDFESFSQEFRLTSNYGGNVNFQTGLFYLQEEQDAHFGSWVPLFDDPMGFFDATLARESITETVTYSVFGEVNFTLSDRWGITLGARWTEDERKFSGDTFGFPAQNNFDYQSEAYVRANRIDGPGLGAASLEKTATEPSWRISTMFNATENTNIWGSISSGFRGGDPNLGAEGPANMVIVEPEFLTAYEIGVKSSLLDGAMSLEASYYYYDYEDKQVFVESPSLALQGTRQTLTNAGQLTINGFEASMRWQASDALSITAGYSYIDTSVDDFVAATDGAGVPIERFDGNPGAYSPEHSGNLIVNYGWDLGNSGRFTMQADASYTGEQFYNYTGLITNSTEGRTLVGAYLGYTTADEKWDIKLWGKNLTDETYAAAGFSFLEGTYQYVAAPRVVGVTVSLGF